MNPHHGPKMAHKMVSTILGEDSEMFGDHRDDEGEMFNEDDLLLKLYGLMKGEEITNEPEESPPDSITDTDSTSDSTKCLVTDSPGGSSRGSTSGVSSIGSTSGISSIGSSSGSTGDSTAINIDQMIMDMERGQIPPEMEDVAAQISPLKLTMVTIAGSLKKRFNLDIIAPTLNKKEMDTKSEDGATEKDEKSGFDNQLTFHIPMPQGDPLNLKLFTNGRVVAVGCKRVEDANYAMAQLVPKLMCTGLMTIHPLDDINKFITADRKGKRGKKWKKSASSKAHIYNIISEAWDTYFSIYNDDEGRKKRTLGSGFSMNEFDTENPVHDESQRALFIFTIARILGIYYSLDKKVLHGMLEDLQVTIKNAERFPIFNREQCGESYQYPNTLFELFCAVCQGWTGEVFQLELKSYMEEPGRPLAHDPEATTIGMIKGGFKANFNLDRDEVNRLMYEKYQILSQYDPDNYPGVKVTLPSSADCVLHNPEWAIRPVTNLTTHTSLTRQQEAVQYSNVVQRGRTPPKQKCHCGNVTILIFRNGGNVMITGAKSWKQVEYAELFARGFLLREYDSIQPEFALDKISKKKEAPSLIKEGDHIYINKSAIIAQSRNFLLIKKFELQTLFTDTRGNQQE